VSSKEAEIKKIASELGVTNIQMEIDRKVNELSGKTVGEIQKWVRKVTGDGEKAIFLDLCVAVALGNLINPNNVK